MRRILGFAAFIIAVAAAAFFMPKSHAVTGVSVPYSEGVIPLVRRVTNVSGGISNVRFYYRLTAKDSNPAPVSGNAVTTYLGGAGLASDANIVTYDCTLNLRNLVFSKVGDYVFTISETSTTDSANFSLDANKYDVFVQVTNVLDENGEPTGELEAHVLDQLYDYKTDSKVSKQALFEAPANYTYITLDSKVSGAAADTDQYFKYKVNMTGLANGAKISVAGQDAEVVFDGESVATTSEYTVGSGDLYVYLKHGQEAVIGHTANRDVGTNAIPQGMNYTIEKIGADDGYATKIDGSEVAAISKETVATTADDFAEKNTTLAVNSKDATVNTGVFASTWPFLIVAAFGVSGFLISHRISKSL